MTENSKFGKTHFSLERVFGDYELIHEVIKRITVKYPSKEKHNSSLRRGVINFPGFLDLNGGFFGPLINLLIAKYIPATGCSCCPLYRKWIGNGSLHCESQR